MLCELLLRDWRLNQRAILISVALFAAFQVYFVIRVDSTRAWFVFTSFYAAFLILTVFAREDKFRCASWTCSLPVTRREIVGARFAGAWLQVAGALAVAIILAVVVPGSRIDLAGIVQPETLLLAATVAAVVVALMLPFTIRFGLIGVMIFLVAAQVLGAGALFLAIALRPRGGSSLRLGFSAVADGVRAVHASLPLPAFSLLVLALLAAVSWGGHCLAVHLYRRREM